MKTKYKIGDKVKVIGDSNGHWMDVGKIVTVLSIDSDGYTVEDKNKEFWYLRENELSPLKKTIRDVEIGDEVIDDLEGEQIIMDVGINGFITESCYYCTFDKAEKDGWEVKEEEETKYDPCSECLYKSEYLKARI